MAAGAGDQAFDPDSPMDDGNPLGTPEAEITWQVDTSDYLVQRRASLEAHRSQATDIEGMLSMPAEFFAMLLRHVSTTSSPASTGRSTRRCRSAGRSVTEPAPA